MRRIQQPRTTTRTARTTRTAAALAVGLAFLAGCSGGGSSADQDVPRPAQGYDSGAESAYDGSAAGSADESGSESSGATPAEADASADGSLASVERLVISTGDVHVSVEDPVTAADEVVALVEGVGGRVDSRSIVGEAEEQHPWASLVVRIPAADLTTTLASLDDVGETVRSEIAAQDVTGSAQDLDARIRAKELSVTRLEALLASAGTNAELIEAESALTTRQSELEEMQSQRTRLGDQAAMSTITIELTVPSEVPVVESRGFTGGLGSGWAGLVSFVTTALVVVGVLLPWVLALGAVGGLVLLAVRLRRSRRRSTGPQPAGPA
jgi:Domain of unknown function (DUF4349)